MLGTHFDSVYKMTRKIAGFLLLTSLLWLNACSNVATSADPSRQALDDVLITGQASGAPEGCGVREVSQVLLDFAYAVHDGDPEAALTYFNSQAPFAWYSAPDSDPAAPTAIYSTSDLPKYFERRHAQNEILQFKQINVNGWEAGRGIVHFDFIVNRQADDLNNGIGLDMTGKGALHCQTQSFVVISIGDG